MDLDIEKTLGIGLVRNEEYIGLYLNLTAWHINATTNVIQLSLSKGLIKNVSQIKIINKSLHCGRSEINHRTLLSKKNENGSVQAGTHLIIMDDSPCKDTAARSSNPAILNYYRQFLIKGYD